VKEALVFHTLLERGLATLHGTEAEVDILGITVSNFDNQRAILTYRVLDPDIRTFRYAPEDADVNQFRMDANAGLGEMEIGPISFMSVAWPRTRVHMGPLTSSTVTSTATATTITDTTSTQTTSTRTTITVTTNTTTTTTGTETSTTASTTISGTATRTTSSSSITTPTTTTSISTTTPFSMTSVRHGLRVEGNLQCSVANPSSFAQQVEDKGSAVYATIASGIAQMHGVPLQLVDIQRASVARRLGKLKRQLAAGTVSIEYEILLPATREWIQKFALPLSTNQVESFRVTVNDALVPRGILVTSLEVDPLIINTFDGRSTTTTQANNVADAPAADTSTPAPSDQDDDAMMAILVSTVAGMVLFIICFLCQYIATRAKRRANMPHLEAPRADVEPFPVDFVEPDFIGVAMDGEHPELVLEHTAVQAQETNDNVDLHISERQPQDVAEVVAEADAQPEDGHTSPHGLLLPDAGEDKPPDVPVSSGMELPKGHLVVVETLEPIVLGNATRAKSTIESL